MKLEYWNSDKEAVDRVSFLRTKGYDAYACGPVVGYHLHAKHNGQLWLN